MAVNLGCIFENVVASLLKSSGFQLRYLNKKNIGEIDFFIQQNNRVIPIEIKSGKDYRNHPALNNALKVREWDLDRGLVFYLGNLERTERITYLPWY
ncbi:MAG: DUF4143 domain-containing protein [Succinivibrio sp.]|nr:DUF4143 domain-containing protein [Succinivibrio sp.]